MQHPIPLGPVELGELSDLSMVSYTRPARRCRNTRLLDFGLVEKHPEQELYRITELGSRINDLVRRGAKQHGLYFIKIGKRPCTPR